MSSPSPSIGQVLGHYRLIEQLGAGGMGVVYRARDERLDRDVALKVLPPGSLVDAAARKRLRKEALALARLNHPNIAVIHDFDTDAGIDFLVMEYVRGPTLADKLLTGPLAQKQILSFAEQIAKALSCAHHAGIVHRDLKPGNVVISTAGEVKLLDFGLARLLLPQGPSEQTLTITHPGEDVAGTLPYMAPEQLRGCLADPRTDIYAFGAVLYELVTGHRPFEAKLATALVADIQTRPPVPPRSLNPQLPARLEEIILKSLEKDPDQRYQSVRELAIDLHRVAAGSLAVAAASTSRPWPWKTAVWGLAVLVVVAAVAVAGLNLGGWRDRLLGSAPGPEIKSLAVLPLENLSHDPAQNYFADGMTEALITDLGQIGALRVISRTSVTQYEKARKPLRQIARDLKVDAVIEGSALHVGTKMQITARLIAADSDTQLWSASYERELRDIFSLQHDVARSIAEGIRVKLTPKQQSRLLHTPPINPQAYESYLKGRYLWYERSPVSIKNSLEAYQLAIAREPNFALAYAGLADSYTSVAAYELEPRQATLDKAKLAARKALELDPQLAEAHWTLAEIASSEWKWGEYFNQIRRTLQLNPNLAIAHQSYGEHLSLFGQSQEAVAELRRARELDPASPLVIQNLGMVLYFSRRYDEAIEQYKGTLEMAPNLVPARLHLGMAYLQKGMYSEGIAELDRARELSHGHIFSLSLLGYGYALSGRRAEARKMIEQLSHPPSPLLLATVYVGLKENDRALAWLEQAYQEHSNFMESLRVEPIFDPLRTEPRFQDLVRRVGLQQSVPEQ